MDSMYDSDDSEGENDSKLVDSIGVATCSGPVVFSAAACSLTSPSSTGHEAQDDRRRDSGFNLSQGSTRSPSSAILQTSEDDDDATKHIIITLCESESGSRQPSHQSPPVQDSTDTHETVPKTSMVQHDDGSRTSRPQSKESAAGDRLPTRNEHRANQTSSVDWDVVRSRAVGSQGRIAAPPSGSSHQGLRSQRAVLAPIRGRDSGYDSGMPIEPGSNATSDAQSGLPRAPSASAELVTALRSPVSGSHSSDAVGAATASLPMSSSSHSNDAVGAATAPLPTSSSSHSNDAVGAATAPLPTSTGSRCPRTPGSSLGWTAPASRTHSVPSAPPSWRPNGAAPARPSSRGSAVSSQSSMRQSSQARRSRSDLTTLGRPPSATTRKDHSEAAASSSQAAPRRCADAMPKPPTSSGLCTRTDCCTCANCVADYSTCQQQGQTVAGAGVNAVPRRRPSLRLVPHSCESHWAQLPDVVLLQVVISVGPGEVCAAACTCSTWAETVTASEEWLWTIVGSLGAGIPPNIFGLLRQWSGEAKLNLRSALQLWLCRAHLWGGGVRASANADLQSCNRASSLEAFSTIECQPLACDAARICCTSWPGSGDEPPGAAIATAGGLLTFCQLNQRIAPTSGLRGMAVSSMEVVASVRFAHGRELITSIRPLEAGGQKAISSGMDGLLRIWDCRNAAELEQVRTDHTRGTNALALCPGDPTQVLCCGDDGLGLIYDLTTAAGSGDAQPLRRFEGHAASAYCTTWLSADCLATGGFDRRTLLWDRRMPASPTASLPARTHVYALAAIGGSSERFDGGATSATSLAVALSDGTIAQWDIRNVGRQPLRELRGHGGAVEEMAILPGDVLASASADGTLRLWDAGKSGEPSWMWAGSRGPLTGVSAVLEDSLLVVGVKQDPVVLSLDYSMAAVHVPEVLSRLRLPGLRPWSRTAGVGGLMTAPPEGHGRHSALLRRQRLQRGAASKRGMDEARPGDYLLPEKSSPRGAFDRSQKVRAAPLGSTGAAHRAYLCGARR